MLIPLYQKPLHACSLLLFLGSEATPFILDETVYIFIYMYLSNFFIEHDAALSNIFDVPCQDFCGY